MTGTEQTSSPAEPVAPPAATDLPTQLQTLYSRRFESKTSYRDQVWRTLIDGLFNRWIDPSSTILDLGCGYGEFINNVTAARRLAMDLNPDTRQLLAEGVEFVHQDCSDPWPVPPGSLDVVFSSNFLEHLPTKDHLTRTIRHARRSLRAGGTIILMGPNVRFVPGAYWDFYDHHIPLTERSVVELLESEGFEATEVHPRVLPYTMSDGRSYPQVVLRTYLRVPFAWRLFGKQFLVVARSTVTPSPGAAAAR